MKYDVIAIGAGSGGLNIAAFMNKAGFNVLLIDKSDASIGGDCLNTGCVPSKALLHCARMIHDARHVGRFGVKANGTVDLKKVMDYVHSKQEFIRRHENAAYFRSKGIDVVLGKATFAGPDSVSVNGKVYQGKKIVIATGSRARKLDIPGIDKVKYLTNENIFKLQKLPQKFVIVGGGPIGIEMAQAFNRMGSHVTVVEYADKFLPKETPESAQVLRRRLEEEGVKFLFNTRTKKFTSSNKLIVENKEGNEMTLEFDEILVSIGRVLNTDLDLDKAGIEMNDRGGIVVDEYLRTTNKRVFVCGDVAGGFQFTHAAELHAGVLINNFFSPFKKKLSYDHISWVTYTDPEIATFGLQEQALQKRGIAYEKLSLEFNHEDRPITDEYTYGSSVVYIDKKGTILGGSMVAPNAGELFQELVLANSAGLNIKHIFNKTYPYPTAARVNKRLVATHFGKKLTPFVKKLMHWLY